MIVEFIKPRRGHSIGDIAQFPDGAANLLIKRGFCKPFRRERPVEMATVQPTERAVMRKRKGN